MHGSMGTTFAELGLGLAPASVQAAFNALRGQLAAAVSKFTARQRALPVLEGQIRALERLAPRIPDPRAKAIAMQQARERRASFEKLRARMATVASSISSALGKLREWGGSVGLSGLGVLPIVPVAVSAAVVAVAAAVAVVSTQFDQEARAMRDALRYAERNGLSPEETRKLLAGLPDSSALDKLLEGAGTLLGLAVLGVVLYFAGPKLLRGLRSPRRLA